MAYQVARIEEVKKNIREAIGLYIEDVMETDDEKDFIPGSAPLGDW